jgi:ferritin-like metal-binding protein YciE
VNSKRRFRTAPCCFRETPQQRLRQAQPPANVFVNLDQRQVFRAPGIPCTIGRRPRGRVFVPRRIRARRWNEFDGAALKASEDSLGSYSLIYVMESVMAKAKASPRNRKSTPEASELLVLELQEIHSAENQLSRVLPRLSKAVQSDPLRQMLEQRLVEGGRIISDIEAVLDELDESPGRKKNVAAEGLINDAREHAQEIENGPALDAVLIGALQKTEHYCIAAWGTARALAEAVGQKSASSAMDRALKAAGPFDQDLTKLAEEEIVPALLSNEDGAPSADDEGNSSESRPQGQRRSRSEQRAGR